MGNAPSRQGRFSTSSRAELLHIATFTLQSFKYPLYFLIKGRDLWDAAPSVDLDLPPVLSNHDFEVSEADGKITELTEKLEAAQKLIAELQDQKKPPPPFVKANIKKEPDQPKKERKKRPPSQNGVRRLEIEPTETLEKKPDKCPTCQNQLGGVSLSRKRQVIELPEPSPLRVTEPQG
ncbi:MAG: hypothetical protein HXX20_05080 [Chloroflexi bacterium]|nr:hypothetical protein [Chloroflexota bacterium]